MTFYYPIRLEDYRNGGAKLPLTVEGLGTRWYPEGFVKAVLREGAAASIPEGIVQYDNNAVVLLDRAKFPYGEDARGRPLVPYVSCAVDPKQVKLGSIVLVDVLQGVTEFEGPLLACDTGGAIVENRIDVFVPSAMAWKGLLKKLPPAEQDGMIPCRVTWS